MFKYLQENKDKIVSILAVIVTVIIFFKIYSFFEEREYQEQRNFFINSCIKALYYDNGYGLNELFGDFTKELPIEMRNEIENYFLGHNGYLAYLDDKKIKNLCGGIYDFYREDVEGGLYNYCDDYICR